MNRALTAILLTAIGSLACANRGMHAPDDGGPAGTAGRGGSSAGGRGGGGGTAAQGGTGGGPTGTAGTSGTTGAAGNCNVAAGGASGGAAGGACGAMFNFESGTQGATIGSGNAFTGVTKSGAFTFCGSGALAITASFSGLTGPPTKGEILLDLLPTAPMDLTGKTITVHVASDPGCSQSLALSLVLNTQAGPIYFNPNFPITGVTNTWKTGTATVPAVNGSTSALALSLQATSQSNYQGTIYIDEIDVR